MQISSIVQHTLTSRQSTTWSQCVQRRCRSRTIWPTMFAQFIRRQRQKCSTWGCLKAYFSLENQSRLYHLTPLMDIPSMVAAFAGTGVGTVNIPSLRPPLFQFLQPQEASCVSSSSSSRSSNRELTASTLLRLLRDFTENFKAFTGIRGS